MIHKAIKGSVIAAGILFSAGIFAGCNKETVPISEDSTKNSYYDMEFHRGGRDARPENTLFSYQYALENGAKK